jgi:uncharacterized protein (UPF0335 family)
MTDGLDSISFSSGDATVVIDRADARAINATIDAMDATDTLKTFVERIERKLSEKEDISIDIRNIYAEAKWQGYCAKALKKIIARRAMDADRRRELDDMIELYEARLGMDRQRSLF